MPIRERVMQYIASIRRRLQLQTAARGLAISGIAAFLLTMIIVLAANAWKFTDTAVGIGSAILWISFGAVIAWFLVRPLLRKYSDTSVARFVEEQRPEFKDRLVTAVELQNRASADETARMLGELVSEDAMRKTFAAQPAVLIEKNRITHPFIIGLSALALILLLGLFGPGFLRYGTKALWLGWITAKADPLYQLSVTPGNLTIGRNTDQEIVAQPMGYVPEEARLFTLPENTVSWESASMVPQEAGGGFHFLLMDVGNSIEYFVESGGIRSPNYKISVTDIPHIERLEVRYQYPRYTGLPDFVEEQGGDISALRGTTVTLIAHTDIPARGGKMVMDDGTELTFELENEKELQASWQVSKDAMYHIRLRDHRGEEARASQEYMIQVLEDASPQMRLVRPGKDADPTPIDEVLISFEVRDDVRLGDSQMRYSVNGGEEKTVPLGRRNQTKEMIGEHMMFLEDFKMIPGDLVSFYGEAKDAAGNSTQTDMYFIQTRPYERTYTQGQAGGGGGGGSANGQENSFLSQQQKEIIAATWNVIRQKEKQRPEQVEQAAQVLSSVQKALREQAETLAARISRRELTDVNEEFEQLVENLRIAVKAMEPAANQLGEQKFQQALSPEQTALQHLLRAEALFQDIQVAFGNQGGGGGGQQNSGQDLADLFALELDTDKNQYETLQELNAGGGEGQNEEAVNEAMRKLQELARRQESLARQEQERQNQSMRAANRWEQETLRREAEELSRRLEELSRQTNSSRLNQASRALSQAARDMQQASSQSSSDGRSERARALERMKEASNLMSGQQNQRDQEALQELAQSAQQMTRQQEKIAEDTGKLARENPAGTEVDDSVIEQVREMLREKQKLLENLRDLERKTNESAGRMSASQSKASKELRGAAASIQEERMADKLRQGSWLSQRGMWSMAAPVEDDLRSDLEALSERIRDAQGALQPGSSEDKLREALEAAQRVRQGLESMEGQRQGEQGQQGEQSGQGSQQQNQAGSQQNGNQPGSRPGDSQSANSQSQGGGSVGSRLGVPSENQRGGMAGRWTGGYRGGDRNAGDLRASPATQLTPEERRQLDEMYRSLAGDAINLQELLADSEDFDKMVQELVRAMQNLDPGRFRGNPDLLARERENLIGRWKELELRLSRELKLSGAEESVRIASQERVSEKYRSLVEEYYRSLSRTPKQVQ